jgi:hypothetical protein
MSPSKISSSFKENIVMVLALHAHKNKCSKHGGLVLNHTKLRRERLDADLTRNYFADPPIDPDRWFCRQFWMGMELLKYITEAIRSCTTPSDA